MAATTQADACARASGTAAAHRSPHGWLGSSTRPEPNFRPAGGSATLTRRAEQRPDDRTDSPAYRHRSRRSEEHTSELQSLMRISYAVFCLKKKKDHIHLHIVITHHRTQSTILNIIFTLLRAATYTSYTSTTTTYLLAPHLPYLL